ncbi:zinc finger CCCH domain-containing protein 25-like [Castanea sativa]|uniref:zinc finger CCCH domain-containing protein 25-like n=1 Tax=Castanea sativa TaxID=21020 RepID=UPI003F64C67C
MNPLTLVKRIQNINSREAALGIFEEASWHAKYKDSAYVYAGGIPFDLTEEIVDVNLVRDKGTGKSKGFAFVAYEDQRSTNLAVDNLNGAQVLGRIIRVDHVSSYKKKEEEDEEAEQKKREERGVCRAFQRGECTRGAGCKFSHNEQFSLDHTLDQHFRVAEAVGVAVVGEDEREIVGLVSGVAVKGSPVRRGGKGSLVRWKAKRHQCDLELSAIWSGIGVRESGYRSEGESGYCQMSEGKKGVECYISDIYSDEFSFIAFIAFRDEFEFVADTSH